MKKPIVNWLKQSLAQIQDVKAATTEPDRGVVFQNHPADLVIQTWMGGRLYLYIFHRRVKLSDIRNKLKQNSRSGIGSQFLVHSSLLPEDEAETYIPAWVQALHTLNGGFVYAFQNGDTDLTMKQVHFEETLRSDEFRCRHSEDFAVEHISIRRRSINGILKGEWVVGDLASPPYKRQIDTQRAQKRYHYKTKTTRPVSIAPADKLQECYEFLQIEPGASERDVKFAYYRLARKLHPDVSDAPVEEAETQFKELKAAYEFIKDYRDWK